MMNHKKKNPFSWPFSKHRMMGIDRGDSLCRDAETLTSGISPACVIEGEPNWRHWRRAARFYEQAACVYARVGMGALAKDAYDSAATCWMVVGDEEMLANAERLASSIETYWEDEDDDA